MKGFGKLWVYANHIGVPLTRAYPNQPVVLLHDWPGCDVCRQVVHGVSFGVVWRFQKSGGPNLDPKLPGLSSKGHPQTGPELTEEASSSRIWGQGLGLACSPAWGALVS